MKTIAIIGASSVRSKFGNKAVRVFAHLGYRVFPVHPKAIEIEGHKAYASILEVPAKPLDMVSVYLPPEIGIKVLNQVAQVKPKEVWLNPGADSDELMEEGEKLGLKMVAACSIVAQGESPSDY